MADGGSLEFVEESPSSWAEWVEITSTVAATLERMSPSSWAEWVEMVSFTRLNNASESPSSWAEWVEMYERKDI